MGLPSVVVGNSGIVVYAKISAHLPQQVGVMDHALTSDRPTTQRVTCLDQSQLVLIKKFIEIHGSTPQKREHGVSQPPARKNDCRR